MLVLFIQYLPLVLKLGRKVFPGQEKEKVPPARPGSSLGSLPRWTCPEPHPSSRQHPDQMYEPAALLQVSLK